MDGRFWPISPQVRNEGRIINSVKVNFHPDGRVEMKNPLPLVVIVSEAGREADDEALITHDVSAPIAWVIFLHKWTYVVLVHANGGGNGDREAGFVGHGHVEKVDRACLTISRGADLMRRLTNAVLTGVESLGIVRCMNFSDFFKLGGFDFNVTSIMLFKRENCNIQISMLFLPFFDGMVVAGRHKRRRAQIRRRDISAVARDLCHYSLCCGGRDLRGS